MAYQPRAESPTFSYTQSRSPSLAGHDEEEHEGHELENITTSGTRPVAHVHTESQASLLVPGQGDGSDARPRRKDRVRLQWWHEHTRRLRREGVFVCLAILAVIMVVINFVQAALLEHFNRALWITAFPLAVLGMALLLVAFLGVRSREHLLAEWKEAKTAERVAWIGIVLSILLTIVLCQFVYMPFVAVPAAREVKWTASMDVSANIKYPAVVIAWSGPDLNFNFSRPNCTFTPEDQGSVACATTDVFDLPRPHSTDDFGQYVIFNSTDQAFEVINQSPDGANSGLVLATNMTYNSKIGDSFPQFYIGFFDPSITFSWKDFNSVCGNPPVYYCLLPQLSDGFDLLFHATANVLDDQVGALNKERAIPSNDSQLCSPEVLALSKYKYYSGRYDSFQGGDFFNSSCDKGFHSSTNLTPCTFILQLYMASSVVTTQTSGHGTDALHILIDEGSIVGGITFFMWFLSIFAV